MSGYRVGLRVLICLSTVAGILAVATPQASAATDGPLVFGINPFDNTAEFDEEGLQSFNAATGDEVDGFVITNAGGPEIGDVTSGNGLAVDPTSSTAYAMLKLSGTHSGRTLATIDLETGEATMIDDTGHAFSGITFTTAGVLWGVTGDGSTACPACLYTINKTNGDVTHVKSLGTSVESDGEAIVFNPVDGLLYHTSGQDDIDEAVFETIDPANPLVAPVDIGYTGDIPDEVAGIGFDPDTSSFIATDIDFDLWRITTGGVTTLITPNPEDEMLQGHRGLIIAPDPVDPVAVDDRVTVLRNADPTEFNVLENDIDGTGADVGTITSVSQPPFGFAEPRNLGTAVAYEPDPNYCNDQPGVPLDVFTYTLDTGSVGNVLVEVECPEAETAITLKYDKAKRRFKGKVTSVEPACVAAGAQVDIFKQTNPSTEFVTGTVTLADGSYKSDKRRARGKYFSEVQRLFVPNVVNCNSSTSPTIKVR